MANNNDNSIRYRYRRCFLETFDINIKIELSKISRYQVQRFSLRGIGTKENIDSILDAASKSDEPQQIDEKDAPPRKKLQTFMMDINDSEDFRTWKIQQFEN